MSEKKSLSTGCIVAIGVAIVGLIFVISIGGYFVSTMNTEVGLRNTITAKVQDNESEFDNMFKKISQVAQVSEKQMDSLKDIFNSHATSRAGEGGQGGVMMNWIKESIPNVDTKVFANLQNIITGSRDRWTMRQKELVDLKREHDNLLDKFPSSMVCSILGKEKIEITIVSSSRAKKAMQTGIDDDINVFKE